MKDNSEICSKISKKSGISYRACCPNMHGLKAGIKAGIKEFNFFSSPSETFHKKNINCSIVKFFQYKYIILLIKRKKDYLNWKK